jgi:UDP-N-acetylglucosamine acyltransferase
MLAPGSTVGRLVDVGERCSIGPGAQLMRGVLVDDGVAVGARTVVYPGAALGFAPQDRKYGGGPTWLHIGADCVIRDGARVERGTETGGGETVLGDRVLVMAGSYVGHDCRLGDGVVVSTNVSLAGHVEVQQGAVVGGHACVHQYVRIGCHAMVGGMTAVRRDVLPWAVVAGSPPVLRGLNTRRLFPALGFAGRRAALAAYSLLFPTPGSAARAATLPLPRARGGGASLRDRLDALDAVCFATLLRAWRRPGWRADDETRQAAVLRCVFRDISRFARESERTRGIHVPAPAPAPRR